MYIKVEQKILGEIFLFHAEVQATLYTPGIPIFKGFVHFWSLQSSQSTIHNSYFLMNTSDTVPYNNSTNS